MRFRIPVALVLLLNFGCDAFGYQEGRGSDAKAVFVLAHGLGANAELGFSNEIADALVADGYDVYKTEVPAFDSVANRASVLAKQVDGVLLATGKEKIHIIGHSMGGLDARYMISSLGYAGSVASLTTVATPHRGSPVADWMLEDDGAKLDQLGAIFGDDEATKEASRAAVVDLSVAQAASFNAANTDKEGVRYLSWGGFATAFGTENDDGATACATGQRDVPAPDSLGVPFLAIATIVSGDERVAHDGLVPVASAQWGEWRGCVAADHFDEVGIELGGEFDSVALFRQIAAEVAP